MKWKLLILREDKLIKTVVVHNGYRPVRYYMFLFPDSPNFSTNLGEPLFLSPLIETGQIVQARQVLLTLCFEILYKIFLKKTVPGERIETSSSC